jgi:hypothetical protein
VTAVLTTLDYIKHESFPAGPVLTILIAEGETRLFRQMDLQLRTAQ